MGIERPSRSSALEFIDSGWPCMHLASLRRASCLAPPSPMKCKHASSQMSSRAAASACRSSAAAAAVELWRRRPATTWHASLSGLLLSLLIQAFFRTTHKSFYWSINIEPTSIIFSLSLFLSLFLMLGTWFHIQELVLYGVKVMMYGNRFYGREEFIKPP